MHFQSSPTLLRRTRPPRRSTRRQELGATASDPQPQEDLTHELRNGLSTLLTHARLLLDQVESPSARRAAEEMLFAAKRMQTQLDRSAAGLGVDRIRCELTDLNGAARAVVRHLRPVANEAGVVLELDVGEAVLSLCDPTRVEQVLVNLVRNAIRASGHGGCVTVSCRRREGLACIEVSDTGPGLPGQLEELATRGATSKRGEGHGLGLDICRRIAEAHGGELQADQLEPRGALLRLCLPVFEQAEVDGRRPELLIAEDDTGIVRALARLLRGQARVTPMRCPWQAMEEAARRPAGTTRVLVDLGLYGSGVDALLSSAERILGPRAMREKLVLTTGASLSGRELAELRASGVTLLLKPFDADTALNTLTPGTP